MTTEVNVTEKHPDGVTPATESTLIVEAVTTAADANATAETALETAHENEAAISEVEETQAEIAREIERVESWQQTMATELSQTRGTVELLTAAQTAQAETLAQILALLTPPQTSHPSGDAVDPVSQTEQHPAETPAEQAAEAEHQKRHRWL